MAPLRRVKLTQLNAHLVCVLCSGYFVDATTIIECLHTFCKTCIVRYLQTSSFCPICDVQVHKTKPLLSLREDRTLQDVVFKLVPGLFQSEMKRRYKFYKEHPEGGGDKTEQSLRERRHFFHVDDQISLSLEHVTTPPCLTQTLVNPHLVKPLKVSNGQQGKQQKCMPVQEEKNEIMTAKEEDNEACDDSDDSKHVVHKRYLRCPAAVQVLHLEKFVRLKYNLSAKTHRVEIMHGGDCLMGELTLLDVVYMYKWTEDAPLRLTFTVSIIPQSRKRPRSSRSMAIVKIEAGAPPCKTIKLHNSDSNSKVIPSVINTSLPDYSRHDKLVKTESKIEKPQDRVSNVCTNITHNSYNVTNLESSLNSYINPGSTAMKTSSIISCSTVGGQVINARARSALTTTTPANSTPRVALTQMSSIPSTTGIVPAPPSTLIPNLDTKTSLNSSISVSTTKISTAMVNGVNDCGLKQVQTNSSSLHGSKIPHSIIPTRPRLGRPPNPTRINAMKMRPRLPLPNLDIRSRSPNNKVYPSNISTRPNNVVSASLNVQNRLSSISGPPGKLVACKVSVKRSNDTMVKDGGMPSQHSLPFRTSDAILKDGGKSLQHRLPLINVSSSMSTTTSTTTTCPTSSTHTLSKTSPLSTQLSSPSQVCTNKVSNNSITNVENEKTTPLLEQGTLVMEKQGPRPRIVQMEGASQSTKQQSARQFLNPNLKPTTSDISRHLSSQTLQCPASSFQSSSRGSNPPTQMDQPQQSTLKPSLPQQKSQENTQPPNPQMIRQPTSQEKPLLSTLPSTAESTVVLNRIRSPFSSNNLRPSNIGTVGPPLTQTSERFGIPVTIRPTMTLASPAPLRFPSTCDPQSSNIPSPTLHNSSAVSPAPRPPTSSNSYTLPENTTSNTKSTESSSSSHLASVRSSPLPRCTSSSPSPPTAPRLSMIKDDNPSLSTSIGNSASPSTFPAISTSTQRLKSSEINISGQVVSSTTNTTQTSSTKSVSPGAGKIAPKSPGRVRGTNSSPSILSIAQSLANKHLLQRTTSVTSTNNTAINSISIGTTQINEPTFTSTTSTSVYPGALPVPSSSLVPLAAAYMASTYGDSSPDVTAMRNLITLSQTAACIRELNLVAMVKNFPRSNDATPIDLSPTNKAAPQTPLTNGKPVMELSSSTTTTKTTNSKSPAKISRPSVMPTVTTATAPTISSPTPEVTITKLPNISVSSNSSTHPLSATTKTTFGSAKLGSSNTNTISITKRPASSKMSITKSPANASLRQIPNPSFVRHQSEARNNNICKPPTSISGSKNDSSVTCSKSTSNVTNKALGDGGRVPGNSPIKETGPLPKTSSILEIENLTKSLSAPAPPAASHGLDFLSR